MSVNTPDNHKQVEDRIKADVQREAPDSNPYVKTHWLRSLIAGFSLRLYDFYRDLVALESRLFPDTNDVDSALRWGNIIVGPQNQASAASGNATATGTLGSNIPAGAILVSSGIEYETTASATIADNVINISSITRSGTLATATTTNEHRLSSSVPVTIVGAVETEYNVTDAEITVTGANTFTFEVLGSPATPATGTITAEHISASVALESLTFGSTTNLSLDTPLTLQTPIAGVDDTFNVDFGEIGGGTDIESIPDYQARYLDKIQNPVAHFNPADISAIAKTVPGVTRVFVETAGTTIGENAVTSITRNGNIATVVTPDPHGLDDGATVTITGANEPEYNEVEVRILVETDDTFHYVVLGAPTSPATGTILYSAKLPLGQVRTFFMRDGDDIPIPSPSEVADVKAAINTILPANTSTVDNIVKAPTANITDYVFTELSPNTNTMQSAIVANLAQFHEEQTTVGVDDDEQAYKAAIKNTVDPITGATVNSFTLSSPVGDLINGSGEIATLGAVTFP